ncbi:MAG: hypothetical protein JWR67_2517 [Mucilaginibacter sp.]|nr:hypothetical protein [Mucilaginibacter sp.]
MAFYYRFKHLLNPNFRKSSIIRKFDLIMVHLLNNNRLLAFKTGTAPTIDLFLFAEKRILKLYGREYIGS